MSSRQKPDCVLFYIICFDCYVSETQVGPTIGPLAARELSGRRLPPTHGLGSCMKEQVNHIKEIIDLLLLYILNAAQW